MSLRCLHRLTVIVVATLAVATAAAETRLLRFPDIHGDRVVFTYAGDLWTASTAGGQARRLTAHSGVELFAKFSPDGRWIAFTGQYDGDEQVYLIPADGGVPRQLTFYPAAGPLPPRWGYDNQVYDWTPDGSSVLFRSMRHGWSLTDTQLFVVPADGGLPRALPMPESGAGDLSPDGTQAVYSPLTRDFRTWKRYEGGWAQDLYIYDLATHEVRRITDHPRTERDPMWIGERICFASDRDGTLNLYAYDLNSATTEQLTHNDVWDVRWPSDDGVSRIVYELNGSLRVFDVATRTDEPLVIDVPDDGLWMRPERVAVADFVEDVALSPSGTRALFVARGDVFSVPVEKGISRNLTRSSGAHDKWARWSPDGTTIAYVSDASGEDELWLIAQDGSTPARRLNAGGTGMLYQPAWSPDGRRIAISDKEGKIHVVDVADGRGREVADERNGQVRDYVWSGDGSHLAFSLSDPTGYNSIYVWSASDGKTRRVTDELFNEFSPAWDPKGNYLFFLADRQFAPQIASIEWNYATDRETGIYALALRKDVPDPFAPQSDEVGAEPTGDDTAADDKQMKDGKTTDDDKKKSKVAEKPNPVIIDWDGLAQRVSRVPVDEDNYGSLQAIDGHLLYVRGAPFYYGRRADVRPALRIFSLEKREDKGLAEEISGYALSPDGKKVIVTQSGSYKVYDAKPGASDPKTVATDGLVVDRVPEQEWRQIFDEVWRRYRDFFYVENMHGYDWSALGERYRALLDHVAHRSDLNYVIGEMIAELNVGHAYIAGGDYTIPRRPRSGLPGANFDLDERAGRYRLAKIFGGHNEEPKYRAPLTAIGVDAREGDFVIAIEGEELTAADNPYERLRHLGDRPVRLTLNDKPTAEGAREVRYQPIANEDNLRYLDWVLANRRRVDELSAGRVGYLHVPDMGADGIYEFIKWFYPQIRKEGLVVDVRGNGGGNVSQMLIERLGRRLLGTRFSRTIEDPRTYPAWVFHGSMVCLLNEDSASDGDIFPHMFRQAGLGPLIGKRSWGGVIGITSHGPLIDGGDVRVPQFGTNDVDGRWVIEGSGVAPDIVVENDPKSVIAGRDPQLERGVAEVLQRIEREPSRLPERPAAAPVKTP